MSERRQTSLKASRPASDEAARRRQSRHAQGPTSVGKDIEKADTKSDTKAPGESAVAPLPSWLDATLQSVTTAQGKKRLAEYLATLPFPHFEGASSDDPQLLVRIDADGTRTLGRFEGDQFQPLSD